MEVKMRNIKLTIIILINLLLVSVIPISSNGQEPTKFPLPRFSNPNHILSDINIEYLCQHWVHSSEEQEPTNQDQIYRPKDFKEFPASRFRMAYIFNKNGDCQWYYLSPDDTHRFKHGNWRVAPNNKSILKIIKDGVTESYTVKELTKDMLRIAPIKSKRRVSN